MNYKAAGGTNQDRLIIRSADVEHDWHLVEQSFEYDLLLNEEDMKKRFGKYGWGTRWRLNIGQTFLFPSKQQTTKIDGNSWFGSFVFQC